MKKHLSLRGGSVCVLCLFFTFTAFSQRLSVLIVEVMFKPDPPVGLPPVEYVELYNRGPAAVQLDSWKLGVGKNTRSISHAVLKPGEYLIVAAPSDTSVLSAYGKVAAVSSLSLSNTSQTLSLYDASGTCVHSVSYSVLWHSASKQSGGWSLEMVDTENPCAESSNWASSIAVSGGTPGQVNSVADANPDGQPPLLFRAVPVDSMSVRLFFTEKMHPDSLRQPSFYRFSHSLDVFEAGDVSSDWKSVLLRLSSPMEHGQIYRIRAVSACDCAGNPLLSSEEVEVALPDEPDVSDMVINEVLFHPYEGGSDFVEICNRSDKVIDLSAFRLSTRKQGGVADTGKAIAPGGWLMFPGDYFCLSRDCKSVCSLYDCPESGRSLVEMNALPTYANSGGTVLLLYRAEVMDEMEYTEDMHYPLLASRQGVSLEKIHPDLPGMQPSSWHSAASSAGYATPGRKNSCYTEAGQADESVLSAESWLFSPDGDGYEDVLRIHYRLPEAGYRGSAWICCVDGRRICRLSNNEMLSTEGDLVWDGLMENGMKAPLGYYVLLFEYWNLQGKVQVCRKVLTVATRLN